MLAIEPHEPHALPPRLLCLVESIVPRAAGDCVFSGFELQMQMEGSSWMDLPHGEKSRLAEGTLWAETKGVNMNWQACLAPTKDPYKYSCVFVFFPT